ncbi:uncharacterized protein LOC131466746 [Solea solea]|uniref:uncharacterized protein LOC131466746 n=1 Tax=Solea solea TaxID=90069 RepID=UPI00272A9B37|nr:uncharacterized protein LOC131466746 [Solea solea]
MEYCFLRGFLVFFLIQHCTSKDLSTSNQSSKEVTLQDGLTSHRELELELPSAEVVPVVAPPTLKEVQQAVQEASEQVEGRGAEEVLKELLERVVEAALTQVDSEVKAGEGAAQEVVEEDTQLTEKGEAKTDTDEQGLKKGLEGEDVSVNGGYTGAGEEYGVAEVDTFEEDAKEGKGITQDEGKTAAGAVAEATVGVETGGKEADGVEVINESLDAEFSQGVAEATLAALDETGVEEVIMEHSNKQDVLSKEAAETGTWSAEESPAIGEVAVDKKTQKETLTVEQSDPSLAVHDEEQLAGALEEKTPVDEIESEVTVLPSDHDGTDSTQTVAGEQGEEGEDIVKETNGPAVEDEQGQLMVEGGAAKEVEAEGTDVGEAAGGEKESERKEASKALVKEWGEQLVEEEQVILEMSHDSETENQA